MKKLLTMVALVATSLGAFALDNAHSIATTTYGYWSGGGTNTAALAWAIVPAHSSVANAQAVVTSLNAYSDSNVVVTAYKVIETVSANYTNATVSIPVTSTNTGTKWDSGSVIIRHLADDSYEKRTLTTSGGQTNLQVTAAPLGAVLPGDIIYKVATAGAWTTRTLTNSLGIASLTFVNVQGENLISGQPGMPILIELPAQGANAVVSGVSVKYVPSATPVPRPGL